MLMGFIFLKMNLVTSPRIELLPERPYFKGLHLVNQNVLTICEL
jgi:hypothetical protein